MLHERTRERLYQRPDFVTALLLEMGVPLTRENYIKLAFMTPYPDLEFISAEEEMEMPFYARRKEFRHEEEELTFSKPSSKCAKRNWKTPS